MPGNESLSYSKSGVNIDETDAVKKDMASNIGRGDSRVLNNWELLAVWSMAVLRGMIIPFSC